MDPSILFARAHARKRKKQLLLHHLHQRAPSTPPSRTTQPTARKAPTTLSGTHDPATFLAAAREMAVSTSAGKGRGDAASVAAAAPPAASVRAVIAIPDIKGMELTRSG